MNEKLKKLMEKRAQTIADMRKMLDAADKENRGLSAEERGNYDKMEADLTELETQINDEKRLFEREESLRGGRGGNPNPGNPGSPEPRTGRASQEYRSAFEAYLRGASFERRALEVGTDAEGGYLVPDEFERRLIDQLAEENIMRRLATVVKSNSGDRKIPVVASHGTASWIDEEGSYTESDDAFGQVVLGAHKVGTLMKVSEELMNDSAFDMEAYITAEFARRIGAAEETAFMTGNGSGKPTGFMDATYGGQTGVTTASSSAVTADELIDLVYALKAGYRRRASFILNGSTIKTIRKLKDGNGVYMWQPALIGGQPDKLLGYDVHTSGNIDGIGAGKRIIAFGDYKYYWISDRQGRKIQRLNELYAANGQIGFRGWQRVDGKLLVPEAVQIMVCHA